MSRRIQRKRTKGWTMPEGAIYVGRPSRWGNPWRVRRSQSVFHPRNSYWVETPAIAVARFRERLAELAPLGWFEPLAGKDLVCWCPLEDEHGNPVPCHADVLLELANAVTPRRPVL